MNVPANSGSKTRTRLLAAAASIAIAGAIGFGAVASGTAPVLADAVKVEGQQVPGFADVVEKVSPAVVSVRVKSKAEPASDNGQFFDFQGPQGFDQLPDDHPLKRFFREFRNENGPQRRGQRDAKPRPVAQGSGFFISEDGYLVTNNHVVDGGTDFTVVTDDGKELDAKLVGTDPKTDVAVLKVDGKGQKFTYVNFADDSKVRVGDWVVAVGNPFGLGGTVTAGIVSARGRDIGAGPYDDFLQIDAAVNHGNSGGPDFNLSGEVVGINTAIFSPSGGSVGIAFAIPASTAKEVVHDLMTSGTVNRGWLGVEIQPVNDEIADSLGLAAGSKGALVANAQDDSPGKKAGIKAGDVITRVDGKKVDGPRELARIIGETAPGKEVNITLWRDGKSQDVKLTLGELKPDQKQASVEQPKNQHESDTLNDFGLTVTQSEDGKGIVVTDVDPGSSADDRGIQAGDVITAVNSTEVTGASDFNKAVSEAAKAGKKAVLVQITRDNSNRFVALPVAKG
ncbi:Do family serine endopeptidase [Mesorhizobium sp. BAC0120]|uniref:Do family serine endopeptidase n=1 Tax=Mesorhizobium sp. BAC0120 TaxID=3090670 RepID=UPI00298CAD21|nr:Do family serine endopeptidase [Mesorhizobium sp. BAC0120]MDW6021125.1 Do family serine endopeptidase [Mesorhizobium sp. BAC0120]